MSELIVRRSRLSSVVVGATARRPLAGEATVQLDDRNSLAFDPLAPGRIVRYSVDGATEVGAECLRRLDLGQGRPDRPVDTDLQETLTLAAYASVFRAIDKTPRRPAWAALASVLHTKLVVALSTASPIQPLTVRDINRPGSPTGPEPRAFSNLEWFPHQSIPEVSAVWMSSAPLIRSPKVVIALPLGFGLTRKDDSLDTSVSWTAPQTVTVRLTGLKLRHERAFLQADVFHEEDWRVGDAVQLRPDGNQLSATFLLRDEIPQGATVVVTEVGTMSAHEAVLEATAQTLRIGIADGISNTVSPARLGDTVHDQLAVLDRHLGRTASFLALPDGTHEGAGLAYAAAAATERVSAWLSVRVPSALRPST